MKVLVMGAHPAYLARFRLPLLRELAQRGHEVVAACGSGDSSVLEPVRALGAQVRVYPLERRGMNPLSDVRTGLAIAKIVQAERPNLLLTYHIKPVLYGSIAARLVGVEAGSLIPGIGDLFQEHGGWRRRGFVRAILQAYRLSLARHRLLFFQNKDDRDFFEKHSLIARRTRVVLVRGSGVDLEEFGFSEPRPRAATFLLAARLIAAKGVREYAAAARKLKLQYPAARFLLAGAPEEHAGISAKERDEWTQCGVEYLGEQADIRPLLRSARVFVLPSYREGTPRSVLEAMAVGRCVITTDAPGCRETVVDRVNGYLVAVRNAEALASAMERCILDPDGVCRMGKASRRLAEERFDARVVATTMADAMDEVMAKTDPGEAPRV